MRAVVITKHGPPSVLKVQDRPDPPPPAAGQVRIAVRAAMQQGEKRSLRRAAPQVLAMLRGFNLIKQMEDSKTVIGLNMLRLWDDRGTLEPWIGPLSQALSDGTAAPVVHAAVPFAEAPEAHRVLAARENVGKVVLVP